MPYANKRNIARISQYICPECNYSTFDVGNASKHKRVHGDITKRIVSIGTPELPKDERRITLAHVKQYFYDRHICPYTPHGLDALMDHFGQYHIHEIVYGNSVVKSLQKLFLATWARDMVEYAKPCKFRNVMRWNHKVYWYRSKYGLSNNIDDYDLFEFPDTRQTAEFLTYELFRLLGDIHYWASTTTRNGFALPDAMNRWNSNALKGLSENICGADVDAYADWMDPIATLVNKHVVNKLYIVRDYEYTPPAIYDLDTDAPDDRRVKAFACPWCSYATVSKQSYTRHNATCRNMIRMHKSPCPPTVYRVAWYTDDEMSALEPFSVRTGSGLDIINARTFAPGSRTSYVMCNITPEQKTSLCIPEACLHGSKRIDDVILTCFGLLFGKHAVFPEFQSCFLSGRYAYTEIVRDGARIVRRVRKESVLLRHLAQIKGFLGTVNAHQFATYMESFKVKQFETKRPVWNTYTFDDIIDKAYDADEGIEIGVIDSTNDAAYEQILKIDGVRDLCRRAVELIPTEYEFVNYLGKIR